MKTICAVTGGRADYGLLKPTIQKLIDAGFAKVKLVATGSHFDESRGRSVSEIEKDELPIDARIEIPLPGDDRRETALSTASAIAAFANYFAESRPDWLLVLGDRYEIFAAVYAAATALIPVAHIGGGQTTEGAVDEFFRHSITKMSSLHLTTCEPYRKRIVQLGEDPDSVFNVGSPGLENALNAKLWTQAELRAFLEFDLTGKYCVVTFHPATLDAEPPKKQLKALIGAIDFFPDRSYLITLANADAGGRKINDLWIEEGRKRANWKIVPTLGSVRYLSALKYAEAAVGNSSSGIVEAPALKIPTVNIGDRQKGRIRAESVVDCEPTKEAIVFALKKAFSAEFKASARAVRSPFGDGRASEKIVRILEEKIGGGLIDVKKTFYDVDF